MVTRVVTLFFWFVIIVGRGRSDNLLSPPAWMHNYAFSLLHVVTFCSYKKRSHILPSEEPNLRAIRFGSYGDKIWFLWHEDMAVFWRRCNHADYQSCKNLYFSPCAVAVIAFSLCIIIHLCCIFMHFLLLDVTWFLLWFDSPVRPLTVPLFPEILTSFSLFFMSCSSTWSCLFSYLICAFSDIDFRARFVADGGRQICNMAVPF